MRRRLRLLAPVVAIAVVALAVLLVTAVKHRTVREYSLRVPDAEAVALLGRSDRVCEGPVSSPRTFTNVAIWGGPVGRVAVVQVAAQAAGSGRPFATGTLQATTGGELNVTLTRPVPARTRVRICLTGRFNTFSLFGAPVPDGHVAMTGHGHDLAFSLALTDDHHSLLGSLPLAFGRASLFKLSWLGTWMFWVLATALLASFGVAILAVASAAADDPDDDR
jgi:hypothetical protein